MTGKVYLVGAGPGDPDLLTMKAHRLLLAADVVLYDRLVGEQIIAMIPETAEKLYVGKAKSLHSLPQDQINQLLASKAKEGKVVVRLKGGDPFIFGRGGEELEALLPHNITFEVVPGITAASGCAAYAGIPLTHRDYTQGVQFVTGHLKHDSQQLDWPALGQAKHTLVFYMGLSQALGIKEQLLANGMAKNMPVTIVENGTTLQQRSFHGDLAGLHELAAQAKSPSLIVIGHVTQLADKLAWFKK